VQFLKRRFDLYDELCHAAIQDGIELSNAKACKFNHNDFEDLERLIKTQDLKPKTQQVFTLLPNLFFYGWRLSQSRRISADFR
jgi:7-keto-8-aminopelargonate synthetase-like enzyme